MLNFCHIPKCGGSTIRDYIRSRLSSRRANDNDCFIAVYGEKYKIGDINVSALGLLEKSVHSRNITGVVGHFRVREFVDAFPDRLGFGNTFTLIRDPIQRVISNINYMKISPNHRGHQWSVGITMENIEDTLFRMGRQGMGSFQCNWLGLCGEDGMKFTERQIEHTIMHHILCYKVENTKDALNNHVLYMPSDQVIKKNVTAELRGKVSDEGSSTFSTLISSTEFDNSVKIKLREIYHNDYLLYDMAR